MAAGRRQVRQGEQGIRVITAARGKKGAAPPAAEHIRVLFDLMQTEGRPVPVRVAAARPSGSVRPAAWGELATLGLREGVAVPGTTPGMRVATGDWLEWFTRTRGEDAAMREAVELARRVATWLLHTSRRSGIPESGLLRSVQADSVAYLIATRLGLDTSGFAFPGTGSWAGTDERARPGELVTTVGTRIMSVAQSAFSCLGTGHAEVTRLVTGPRLAREDVPRTEGVAGPAAERDGEAARIQKEAARFFTDHARGSWVPGYLAGRGFSEAIQQRWGTGYAPRSWTALTNHLRKLGYGEAAIEASGLARASSRGTLIDVFRDRAMFPVRAPDGTVLGFIGRAPADAGRDVPKYLNTRETSLYRKGQVLFGLHEGRNLLAAGASMVIVEGPLDAVAVTTASEGRYVGVAPCGTALTADQVGQLAECAAGGEGRVLVAFDGDQAGQRATSRAWDLLAGRFAEPLSVLFPPGQDPASVLAEHGCDTLARMLDQNSRPLADTVIDTAIARYEQWLEFLEGKFNALHAVAPLIARLPAGQVARQVGRAAEQLGLTHAEVTTAVTDAVDHIAIGTAPDDERRAQQDRQPVSSPQASSCRPARHSTATGSQPAAARRAV